MINTSNASVSFSRAIVRARHRRSRRASDPTRFERNRPESLPRAPRPCVISRQIRAQLSHSRSGRVQMHLHRYLTHGRSRRPFASASTVLASPFDHHATRAPSSSSSSSSPSPSPSPSSSSSSSISSPQRSSAPILLANAHDVSRTSHPSIDLDLRPRPEATRRGVSRARVDDVAVASRRVMTHDA